MEKTSEIEEVDIFQSSVAPLEIPPPPLPKLLPRKRKHIEIENSDEKSEAEGKSGKKKKKKKSKVRKEKKFQPPRKKRKFSNPNALDPLEKQKRTIKVSNIPFDGDKKLGYYERKFKSLFKSCGSISTVRFRNLPIEKPKHLRYKKIPLFLCVRKGYFAKRGIITCFIVFESEECALKSLSFNETQFEGNTLLVDRVVTNVGNKKLSANDSSNDNCKVFVGNIPFDLELQEFITLMKKKEKVIGGKIEHINLPVHKPQKDTFGNILSIGGGSRGLLEAKTKKLMGLSEVKTRNRGFAMITFENEECVENVFRKRININYKGRHFMFKRFKKKEQDGKRKKRGKRSGEQDEDEDDNEGTEWWRGETSQAGKTIPKKKTIVRMNATTGTSISKKRKRRKRKRK